MGTNKVTYGHSRCFLDIADPRRTNPQTGHHEDRPTPTARTFETMHKDALEYKALLDKKPSAAAKHYEQHGQGAPTPFYRLPYVWHAAVDGMHVVHAHQRVAPTANTAILLKNVQDDPN